MIFKKCFDEIDINLDQKEIIDSCLQALSQDVEEFSGVLDDLAEGESSGFDLACIYLEEDYEDNSCPEFSGVCFNYLQEYAVVTRDEAKKILSCCIGELSMTYEWPGLTG
ncbi:MAG: hypothetical protein P8163_19985 [Candidatus Thiodiazotropha sp.]